jgi:hypothetical protein
VRTLLNQYRRSRHHLSLASVTAPPLDWLVLSPICAARLVSRLLPALKRGSSLSLPKFAVDRSWLGYELDADGRNAADRAAVPTATYLVPGTTHVAGPAKDPTAPNRPGSGLVVESMFGLRGGLDFLSDALQVRLAGALYLDGQPVGTTAVMLAMSPQRLLDSLLVIGAPQFFRVHGLVGGSWTLMSGLRQNDVHAVD